MSAKATVLDELRGIFPQKSDCDLTTCITNVREKAGSDRQTIIQRCIDMLLQEENTNEVNDRFFTPTTRLRDDEVNSRLENDHDDVMAASTGRTPEANGNTPSILNKTTPSPRSQNAGKTDPSRRLSLPFKNGHDDVVLVSIKRTSTTTSSREDVVNDDDVVCLSTINRTPKAAGNRRLNQIDNTSSILNTTTPSPRSQNATKTDCRSSTSTNAVIKNFQDPAQDEPTKEALKILCSIFPDAEEGYLQRLFMKLYNNLPSSSEAINRACNEMLDKRRYPRKIPTSTTPSAKTLEDSPCHTQSGSKRRQPNQDMQSITPKEIAPPGVSKKRQSPIAEGNKRGLPEGSTHALCAPMKVARTGAVIKEGGPCEDALEELSTCIGEDWMQLGRRLLISQAELDEIDHRRPKFKEKAYRMLLCWKQKNSSNATHSILSDALCHRLVNRRDLAENFCFHIESRVPP